MLGSHPGMITHVGRRRAVGLVLLVLLAASCGGREPGRRRIAASIFPLYDLARRVSGERLEVELVLPPGHTTHSFDPKPKDVARLAEANLVFAVGLGLDQWLEGIVKSAGGGRARIFELGPLLDPILVPEPILKAAEGDLGGAHRDVIDPHFWTDPVRMQRATDLVVDALRNLDPEEAPGYRQRGEEVKRALAQLHEETARRAGSWRKRTIVTFHGSFFYFAERYRLEVAAVIEPVPGREPTARYLAETMETIRKSGAPALFSEPQFDRALAQGFAQETGLPLLQLDPVGGSAGVESYEKMLRHNVDVLEQVLR